MADWGDGVLRQDMRQNVGPERHPAWYRMMNGIII